MDLDRVFITGATGFVRSHLIEFLCREAHVQVYGAKRRRSDMTLVQDADAVHRRVTRFIAFAGQGEEHPDRARSAALASQ